MANPAKPAAKKATSTAKTVAAAKAASPATSAPAKKTAAPAADAKKKAPAKSVAAASKEPAAKAAKAAPAAKTAAEKAPADQAPAEKPATKASAKKAPESAKATEKTPKDVVKDKPAKATDKTADAKPEPKADTKPVKKAESSEPAPAPEPATAVADATAPADAPAAPAAPVPAKAAAPKADKPDPKPAANPFDAKFLDAQRKLLLEERAKYTGSADRLQAEANALVEDMEPGDVQFDDESGEGDTLVVERERDLALSAQARQTVAEIDAALARIDAGTYGLSTVSGRPIPKERLKAIPWATVLVEEKVGGLGTRR